MKHHPLALGRHEAVIGGLTQAYEVVGSGPVCLIHPGGPGVNAGYLRIPLLERHMKLVYLDPIGTGASSLLPGGDYSVAEYVRRLELLRAYLDVAKPYLLGHSHGGFVALQYALDHPGRTHGLIIYSAAPTYSPDHLAEARSQMKSFAKRWPDRPEAIAAARMYKAVEDGKFIVSDQASSDEYLNTILPAYFADFRKTTKELGDRPTLTTTYDPARKPYGWDARGRLGAIEEPSLVIGGTYDFRCPPVWSREIHDAIPESRLLEFSGSGHFAHLEEPEEFVRAILGWKSQINL